LTITLEEVSCKFCNSKNVIKYGNYKNIQRWWCKNCRRKFADNRALPRMKIALDIAGPAVGSYYEGRPLNTISQEIVRKHRIYISDSTIFEWVDKFSQLGTDDNRKHHPKVGDIWIVNETGVNICGADYRLIDIIDSDTLFIITTMFFTQLDRDGFNRLMESARDRVGKMPGKIIIPASAGLKRIRVAEIIRNRKADIVFLDEKESRELMERIEGSFLVRNRVLSRLKKKENIRKIMNGWLVHFNYRRANEFLNGATPAEKAGIHF